MAAFNIAAGKLDTRITLLRPARAVVSGQNRTTYTDYKTVWANARQITFRESMAAQVQLQNETYTLVMRYIAGITPDWAVRMRGLRYRILTINADKTAGMITLGIELDNSITQEPST